MGVDSIGGARYVMVLVDGSLQIYLGVLSSSEIRCNKVIQGVADKGRTADRSQLKTIRSDNGGEYTSNVFRPLGRSNGHSGLPQESLDISSP